MHMHRLVRAFAACTQAMYQTIELAHTLECVFLVFRSLLDYLHHSKHYMLLPVCCKILEFIFVLEMLINRDKYCEISSWTLILAHVLKTFKHLFS